VDPCRQPGDRLKVSNEIRSLQGGAPVHQHEPNTPVGVIEVEHKLGSNVQPAERTPVGGPFPAQSSIDSLGHPGPPGVIPVLDAEKTESFAAQGQGAAAQRFGRHTQFQCQMVD